MNMKKILLYAALAALVGTGTVSCKKSLDIDNPNAVDESNFWKNGNDALAGINAVYGNHYRNGAFARWLFVVNSPRSDDGFGSSGWPPLASTPAFTLTDYNFEVLYNIWQHHYQGIYRANQVIKYVPPISMDETLKKRYVAEAKFLRALYYYNLVTKWGNVPLVLEPSTPTDLPANGAIGQGATDQINKVWTQIEKDLSEAAADLPPSYDNANVGRATKGAAYALLGKSLLMEHKYQQAADAFAWLVTGPGAANYDLVANYKDNFMHTTENNRESVYEVQFNDRSSVTDVDDPRSNLGNQRGPFQAPPGPPTCFNDMEMRRWVVYEFLQERTTTNQRDPRLPVTAMFDSTDEAGPNATMVYGATFASRYGTNDKRVWYHKYSNDYFRNSETFEGPINLRVIRYADVLLMYAEALNELNRTTEAYTYVDRVRQRAGLAKLSVTRPGLSKAEFLKQLMHERVTELTGEDVRWDDLARWGYFDDATKLAELKARDPEFNNFTIGKNKYLPIPQSELDINPNLHQNNGY